MSERHIDIWNNCLRFIEQIIEPQKFSTWFKPIRPVSFVGSELTVEVPSEFFRQWLEETYLDVISKSLKRVIGADARLRYQIRVVRQQPAMEIPASHGAPAMNRDTVSTTWSGVRVTNWVSRQGRPSPALRVKPLSIRCLSLADRDWARHTSPRLSETPLRKNIPSWLSSM